MVVSVCNALAALPFVIKILNTPMNQSMQYYEKLCLSLNITGWQRFRLIEYPLLKAPLKYALALATTLSLGDFTAIALLVALIFTSLPHLLLSTNRAISKPRSGSDGIDFIGLMFRFYLCSLKGRRNNMIKLNNVVFNYQSMPMVFDLQIQAQEKIAIIGESGAGKSTLLNLIAGFEYADSGEIWLNGENHTKTAPFERPVSMLFQENNLFYSSFRRREYCFRFKTEFSLKCRRKALVEQAASAVNLQDFLTRKPTALSGGQKQRVALARCLLRDKPILLLDEPFSALDPKLRIEMQDLMDQLCEEKKAHHVTGNASI